MALTQTIRYNVSIPKTVTSKKFMLGLSEKPSAGKRIASALCQKPKKNVARVVKDGTKLPDIEILTCDTEHGRLVIIPALGHLYTLVQNGSGWHYPVYDFKWVPLPHSFGKNRTPTKHELRIEATIEVIRTLASKAQQLIVMTDFDQEGEVIGGVIFKELAPKDKYENILRMKFSSLTKQEIRKSFDSLFKKSKVGLNQGLLQKGLMRHYLDWLWGINLSRALMLSLKYTSGRYQTLSTGRVQGPTLAFVAERQKEIDTFIPVPSFKILADMALEGETYPLTFSAGNLEVMAEAEELVEKNRDAPSEITAIDKSVRTVEPPAPYNLSTLQSDAYRYFRFSPSRTLDLAERLYLAAVITYPRTSSEQYAKGTDHLQTIKGLGRQKRYQNVVKKLLSKKRLKKPKEGKKTDPAHPAISPTGNAPLKMNEDALKLYDMIVRRYLATFSNPVKIENTKVTVVKGELKFRLSGSVVKSRGWWEFQPPPGNGLKDGLPKLREGQEVEVTDLRWEEVFSQPPPYYNEASLLKEMEKAEIGTKATRADIIKALIDRRYIESNPLRLTRLGKIIYEVLADYSPRVISVELSREVEHMGELVEETANEGGDSLTLGDAVLRGISILHSMLADLQVSEQDVGELINMQLTLQNKERYELGPCPDCEDGTLKLLSSKGSGKRFVGCSNYFNGQKCTTTFSVPQRGRIERVNSPCPVDGYPQVKVFSGKRPWVTCINLDCKSVKERQESWARNREKWDRRKKRRGAKTTRKDLERQLDDLK